MAPRSVLFLCVSNSARSQMAEGMARAMLPAGVEVHSAGSKPETVNPLAIRALDELDIDITLHTSKSVVDIHLGSIDTVVTLCAEEVCTILPETVTRLHWPFEDPTAVSGSEEEQLAAFRQVRDGIREHLTKLFG